jgi:ubiquinone/menaquinone biosynthesis C-methylase UbiE
VEQNAGAPAADSNDLLQRVAGTLANLGAGPDRPDANPIDVTFDSGPVRHAYELVVDQYAEKFADELATNDFDRSVIDAAVGGLPAGARLVDVGCGPGLVAAYLAEQGRSVFGLDITPAMLRVARRRNPQLMLVCGSVLALPLPAAAVDGIVAWYAVHNLPLPVLRTALAELRRVLSDGGLLVVATHGGRGEEQIEHQWHGATERVAVTYYAADELRAILGGCGFRVDSVRERPPLAYEHQASKLYVTASAV